MKKVFLFGDFEKRGNYIAALESCGAKVITSTDARDTAGCDGLLLPGGGDLDPALYGEENQGSFDIDPDLDRKEIELAHRFFEADKPILGICRGLQTLNTAFGGSLIQDLPTAASHRWAEADQAHEVSAMAGSFLIGIYGERFTVNSAHHQGVGRLAEHFQIAARADDGVVEAIQWPERKVYGVQWHPERLTLAHRRTDAVDGLEIFLWFLAML